MFLDLVIIVLLAVALWRIERLRDAIGANNRLLVEDLYDSPERDPDFREVAP